MARAQLLLPRSFREHQSLRFGTLAAVIINAGQWVFLTRSLPSREGFLPLHYNIYFGIDLFGQWYYAYLIAAIGTAVLVLNTIIVFSIYQRQPTLAVLIGVTTPVLETLLAVAANAYANHLL